MPLLKQEQVWYSSCCHNGGDQRIYDMKRINKKLGNPSLCSNRVLWFPSPVLLLIFHVLWLDLILNECSETPFVFGKVGAVSSFKKRKGGIGTKGEM